MTPSNPPLAKLILSVIHAIEHDEDYQLLYEDRDFLLESMLAFIYGASHKFIVGAKEHNGDGHPTPFLTSCPHLVELPREIYDAFFYSYAATKSIRSNRS
jgi:hypothetical protein